MSLLDPVRLLHLTRFLCFDLWTNKNDWSIDWE